MTTNTSLGTTPKTSNWKYVWNHKLVFFLLLVLVVGAFWAGIKIISLQNSFNKEKHTITTRFADETSRVFSWAVRSEMMRENKEQVNQFFMSLVKEPGFKKIQLVDVNGTVLISTDKKDEGSAISDTTVTNANIGKQIAEGNSLRTITPVMGLNSRLGVLVIDREVDFGGK